MDNENLIGKIVDFFGRLIKGDSAETFSSAGELSSLKLPDTVAQSDFSEIIGLLKSFLSSSEIQSVAVETRNHLSAVVVEAEKSGVEAGWPKLKGLIGSPRAGELVQPLLAFAFKHQGKFASVLNILMGA
ncbi:MAG: hypothetical protein LBB86_03815 [Oscillospiraceae bacterium]|jgi:hypothetical protein|nr:hypothetical protein [Oscillospiraceae bacterium]